MSKQGKENKIEKKHKYHKMTPTPDYGKKNFEKYEKDF